MKTDINELRKIIGSIPIKNTEATANEKKIKLLGEPKETFSTPEIKEHSEIHTTEFPPSDMQNNVGQIELEYDGKLLFRSQLNNYYVMGHLSQDLSSLQITLVVEERNTLKKDRTKLDLYEKEHLLYYSQQLSELFFQEQEQIAIELSQLTDELESYRDRQTQFSQMGYHKKRNFQFIAPADEKHAIEFLKNTNLLANFDKLIEQTGIVGEENSRKLLFIVASSYKTNYQLHVLVQGVSGSGKSHLINTIGQCFPQEDVISMSRVTGKSLYNFAKDELVNKLILIHDFDKLDKVAKYAFRELQTSGNLCSSTTYKNHKGNISAVFKKVKSHFASLLTTTKSDMDIDHSPCLLVVGIDESKAQINKVIDYQNKIFSGTLDTLQISKAKDIIRNCIRCLKSYEVVNPYAEMITLPYQAKMLKNLNLQFQMMVKQITLIHQYQRKRDSQNRMISEPKDILLAYDILFDAIVLKIDDLSHSVRQFFDKVKEYVLQRQKTKPTEYLFKQSEIRIALSISKSTCFRHFEELLQLEYFQIAGGHSNKGLKFKISIWDNLPNLKSKIKQDFKEQLKKMK